MRFQFVTSHGHVSTNLSEERPGVVSVSSTISSIDLTGGPRDVISVTTFPNEAVSMIRRDLLSLDLLVKAAAYVEGGKFYEEESEGSDSKTSLDTSTDSSSLMFHCELCPDQPCFPDFDNWYSHDRAMHSVERIYRCKICPSSFARKVNLERHVEQEHAPPPKIDEKSPPPEATTTTAHHRVNQRPFGCFSCSFRFVHRRSLNRHIRVKHGLEPPSKTSRRARSSLPKMSTIEVIPSTPSTSSRQLQTFVCKVCGFCFREEQSLVLHLDAFHPAPQFSCQFCFEKYETKEQLDDHYVVCHDADSTLSTIIYVSSPSNATSNTDENSDESSATSTSSAPQSLTTQSTNSTSSLLGGENSANVPIEIDDDY